MENNGLNKNIEIDYKNTVSRMTEILTSTVEEQLNDLEAKSKSINTILNNANEILSNSTKAIKVVKESNENKQLILTKLFESKVRKFDFETQDKIKTAIIGLNEDTRKIVNMSDTDKILNGLAVVFVSFLIGLGGFAFGKKAYSDNLQPYSFNIGYTNCKIQHKAIEGKLIIPEEINYTYFSKGGEQCEAELKQQKSKGALK